MNVCFVVLAHHQPKVFARLIQHIAWSHSDVVVHIDKRSDISTFCNPRLANVHFVPARRRVHRSGWSLTRALCEVLEFALRASRADYFMYLAGTDFPIQRPHALNVLLAQRHPTNFINHYPLVPGIWGYSLIDRYHLIDLKASLADRRDSFRPSASPIRRGLGLLADKAEHQLNRRYLPRNTAWTRFYGGSSRWCLNRETVRFVVSYHRSNESRQLRRYLHWCANSDEIFFQTAILNSEYKTQCAGFDEAQAQEIFDGARAPMPDEKRVYFHYIDWSPEREDPALLDESDFQRLKESGQFFACKFVDHKSLGLVRLIERDMLAAAEP